MKKFSFAKIASLVLAFTMLLGALTVTVLAAEEPTVEIVSNNVFYGETYQLMFAVNAPEGATVSATVDGSPVGTAVYAKDPNPTINGVECKAYIVKEGVAAQAIDTVVTFTVEYNGKVATKDYSVLQYVYERMYVSTNKAEGDELAMFEALLTFASAADKVINGSDSISTLAYVNAVDCTFDGITAGLVPAGTVVYFETDRVAEDGYVINWVITDLEKDSTVKITAEKMENDGYTVNGNVSVQAVVEESTEDKVVELLATFELGENGEATHKDGSSAKTSYKETDGDYELSITGEDKMYPASTDAKGNSCIKFGTSSVAGKCTITVPDKVTKVVIYVAKYKNNTSKINVNGTLYTLAKSSDNGEYDVIEIDTTSNKTISFTTVSGGYRAMLNTVEFHGYAD